MPIFDETPAPIQSPKPRLNHPSNQSAPTPVPNFGRRVRGSVISEPTAQSHGGDRLGFSKRFGYDAPKQPHPTGRRTDYSRSHDSGNFLAALTTAPPTTPQRDRPVSAKITNPAGDYPASAVVAAQAPPPPVPGTTTHANHYQNLRSDRDDLVVRPSSRRVAPQSPSEKIDVYGFGRLSRFQQHQTTLVPSERTSEFPSSKSATPCLRHHPHPLLPSAFPSPAILLPFVRVDSLLRCRRSTRPHVLHCIPPFPSSFRRYIYIYILLYSYIHAYIFASTHRPIDVYIRSCRTFSQLPLQEAHMGQQP